MPNTEIEFEETERQLLDWIEAHASRRDGAVTVSDTQIIRELHLEGDTPRFFAAKMRLVAAGMLTLFVDPSGYAGIQLNQRERSSAVSRRYAMLSVPLELVPEIIGRIRVWRQEEFAPGSQPSAVPLPAIVPKPKLEPKPGPAPLPPPGAPATPGKTRNKYIPPAPEEGLRRVQARLGVRLVTPGPIRPPVKIA